MTKFTIEDLRDIAYRGSYDDLERELALQLLASMEQEPVAYTCIDALDDVYCGSAAMMGPVGAVGEVPLYAAPQLPQPAVAITQHFDTIALDTAKMVMCDVNRRDEFLGGDIQLLSRIQCRIDEACRAAMLQAGDSPITQDDVRRMDWLVSKTVDVREPMVYGSHSLFWSKTITDEEDEYHATKLREQIDAAMADEQAAAPPQEVK